jgi:hypothetical protein
MSHGNPSEGQQPSEGLSTVSNNIWFEINSHFSEKLGQILKH